jgi:DNA gyrase/topoisomerase IV subunit B
MAKIKDDNIYIKKNDIDAMRRRPTMYIGSLGEAGVFHLCKEMIDNNRDECIKKESIGDTIEVEITDKYIRSRDNGRGIPTDLLRIIHETNQAGSNMTRENNNVTAGENGTGTTTYTAMSSELEVITLRPTEKKKLTIRYREGELVDEILEDYNGTDHGLITTFKPSRKVLGVSTIPVDMLREWLKDFDYTLPRSVHMTYTINGEVTRVRHKEPYEYFKTFISEDHRLCNTLSLQCDGNLQETVLDKTYDRTFNIEAAITYANPDLYKGEDIKHSWMNMIHTSQNGSHVEGVIKGFSKYITEKVVSKNKKFEGVNIKKDILSHMSIVVKAECNFANMFSAQAKQTVVDKSIENAVAESVYNALGKITNGVITEIVDVVVGNYRARIEGEKARNISATTKALKTWQKPDSYYPCSTAKTEEPKELFIVEGNSAGGGLKSARNAKYQAIIAFRGKSLNTWDLPLSRALESKPWLNLVKVMGCGIGDTFDIKKLNFDKIIICTDADIDGYHIRVGIGSFFAKWYPDIINAGKLFIAEPPLYKLVKNKDVCYVASQTEYLQKCVESIGDIQIEFPEMN